MQAEQNTPYLHPGLRELVESIEYKPDWTFKIIPFREDGEQRGWSFMIRSFTDNSFAFREKIMVNHAFIIPPASWNRNNWIAWIFDRIRDVENHEAGEFFRINGVREFAPHHSNGEDPYRVWHVSDWETAAKSSGDD